MIANFWIKGWMAWMAWMVKAAMLALLSVAALRAQSPSAAALPFGPRELTKSDFLTMTQHLGLTLENRMQTAGNLVAWATRDSIRFGVVEWGCPLGFCSVCIPVFRPLPGIALPGSKPAAPPPFGIAPMKLRTAKVNAHDVEIAFIMPGGVFYHLAAGLPDSNPAVWSLTTETRTVALKAGESPRMVAIGRSPWDIFRTTLFLGGTGRLLLMAGWDDQNGLSAFAKDPFTSRSPLPEDLISSGGGFFGGSAGGVTGWQYDIQPQNGPTGMQAAVLAVDGSGAMGDDGWIAVRGNSAWKAFHLTPGTYRDFSIVRDVRGLGVLRYPPTGEPVYTHLGESPTHIASIETMDGPINLNPADFTRMTLDPGMNAGIRVVVADSESNFTALRIDLVDAAGDTLRLGRNFTGSNTPGACAGPGICVQPGKPAMEIRCDADSVYVIMTVQAGFVDGACFRLISRTDSVWSASAPWKRGSLLAVRAGRSILEINSGTTGISRSETGGRLYGSGSGSAADAVAGGGLVDAKGRRIPRAQAGGSQGTAVRKFPFQR